MNDVKPVERTLEHLRREADELRASRARVVVAADEQRRSSSASSTTGRCST